jgi:hypothetical protein
MTDDRQSDASAPIKPAAAPTVNLAAAPAPQLAKVPRRRAQMERLVEAEERCSNTDAE